MIKTTPDQWLYVIAPLFLYGIIVMGLFAWGFRSDLTNPVAIFFRSISAGLERVSGYPGWAMAGALSCLWALGTAAVGLYWDVAFHIDYGRDQKLFTPSHTMIVIGLAGIVYAAGIAVLFATLDKAPVRLRFMGLRIPYSAVAMAALGAGGLAGFPLDALWHDAYGIDVTLWSPTHLQLVAGGGLATITAWLMLAEARREARPTMLGRGIAALALGAVLVGASTFQGEFDFGVPQFQVLYLPVLIAVAAGFTLVLARAVLGRGGAVKAVVAYLVLRAVFGLLVGDALHHTFPRFPLYLASALVVEAVAFWVGTDDRLRYGLVAGAGVATLGMVGEMTWVVASGWGHLRSDPRAFVVVPVAALAAALVGAALSRPVPADRFVPAAVAGLAGLFLVGAVLFPLPRRVGHVDAVIQLTPVGRQASVGLTLDPPDAARHATAFGVVAWQGGGRVSATLKEVGPGRYVSSRPLPVTGRWKTVVGLQRQDQVMAAPVYFPADPKINAPAIPAVPERRVSFVRNTVLLLREQHGGPTWPKFVGYGGLSGVVALWVALMAFAAHRISRQTSEPVDRVPGDTWSAEPALVGGNGHRNENGGGKGDGDGDRLSEWRRSLGRLRESPR